VAVAIAACGTHAAAPDAPAPDAAPDAAVFAPVMISTTMPDEDPTLLRTADGHVVLAWYSTRDGDGGNIYLRRTLDGVTWDPAVRVSSDTDTEWYPNLVEANGLRAVWQRRNAAGASHVVTSSSPDGVTWNAASEVAVTPDVTGADDWSPSIAVAPSGTFVIAFARNSCGTGGCFGVMITTSTTGATWSTPVPFGLATTGLADDLPIIAHTGDHLTMVWNRYANSTSAPLPYQTATSEVMLSTSIDGTAWTPAVQLTSNSDPDLFPWLYADDTGRWLVTWLTAANGGTATPMTLEQPVDASAPSGTIATNGYSPRVIATALAHRYVATWVAGTGSNVGIVAQAFAAP